MASSSLALVGAPASAVFDIATEIFRSIALELTIFVATLGLAFYFRAGSASKKACTKAGAPISSDKPRQRKQQSLDPERSQGESDVAKVHPDETSRLVDDICSARGGVNARCLQRLVQRFLDMRPGIADAVRRASRITEADFYTSLLQCVIRDGKPQLVEGILDDMIRDGFTRPLALYESAMKQLAGQKQYQLALRLYDRLLDDGLEPSAVTCSCLIGFANEIGELERAVGFFKKLAAISTPSIRAYMTVLRVHAKRQDWESSVNLFRDMLHQGSADTLALNIVLSTGVAVNRLDAADALLAEVSSSTAHAPRLADAISFNTVMKGYAQQGNLDKALAVLERMRSEGWRPNAISYNTAMDAAVRSFKLEEAWSLLHQMRDAGLRPDKFSCSILIKGLHREGVATPTQVERSFALLRECSKSCEGTLKSSLFHTLLEVSAKSADVKLSLLIFKSMCNERIEPSPTARKLVGLGDLSKAGVEQQHD